MFALEEFERKERTSAVPSFLSMSSGARGRVRTRPWRQGSGGSWGARCCLPSDGGIGWTGGRLGPEGWAGPQSLGGRSARPAVELLTDHHRSVEVG